LSAVDRAALTVGGVERAAARSLATSGQADDTDIEAAQQDLDGATEEAAPAHESRAHRAHREAVTGHRQASHARDAQAQASVEAEMAERGASDPMNGDSRDVAARAARGETVQPEVYTNVLDAGTLHADRGPWEVLRDQCSAMKSEERGAIGQITGGLEAGGEDDVTAAIHQLDNLRGRFSHWAELLRRGEDVAQDTGHDWWHLDRPNLPYWAQIAQMAQRKAGEHGIQMNGAGYAGQLRAPFAGLPV
jgi:hypothetical protein